MKKFSEYIREIHKDRDFINNKLERKKAATQAMKDIAGILEKNYLTVYQWYKNDGIPRRLDRWAIVCYAKESLKFVDKSGKSVETHYSPLMPEITPEDKPFAHKKIETAINLLHYETN